MAVILPSGRSYPERREFVFAFVREFPDLQRLLDEHISAFGELHDHIFMGEVAHWAATKSAESLDDPEVAALLQYVEDLYPPSDIWIQNLIDVSLIENLGYQPPLASRFGPRVREAYLDVWASLSRAPHAEDETTKLQARRWWQR